MTRRVRTTAMVNVVRRRVPFGTMSLRFLFPRLSTEQRYHRSLLTASVPSVPRPVFVVLNFMLWLRWVTFHAHRMVKSAVAVHGVQVESNWGVSIAEQRSRLRRLALIHGVVPRDAYELQLFLPDRRDEMWSSLFSTEFASFHTGRSMQAGADVAALRAQSRLLADKSAACIALEELGVPTPGRSGHLQRGATSADLRAMELPAFCKPNIGNAAKGAFHARIEGGALVVEPVLGAMPLDAERFVDDLLAHDDLLIESFLEPHPDFVDIGVPERAAVVLRIITEGGVAVCAVLELPASSADDAGRRLNVFGAIEVDVTTGRLGWDLAPEVGSDQPVRVALAKMLERAAGVEVPFFGQAVRHVEQASLAVPDVFGIAWDVAICPDGAVVIEGNTGWATAAPQRILGPLVERELRRADRGSADLGNGTGSQGILQP